MDLKTTDSTAGSRRTLAFALAILGFALALLAPETALATSAEDSLTLYYSDATYSTVVGRVRCICGESCRSSGSQTAWDRVVSSTPCTGFSLEATCYVVFNGVFLPVQCPAGVVATCSYDGGNTWTPCSY